MGKMTLEEIGSNCLFRYRDFNSNTLEELLTGNVWHSKPSFLNDPFEFHFEFDWDSFTIDNFPQINNALKAVPTETMANLYLGDKSLLQSYFFGLKEQVEQIVEERKRDLENNSFLCCFASSFDNPLMWSHYSNGMQGLCIAYKKDMLSNSSDFENIVPVEYVASPYKIGYSNLSGEINSFTSTPVHDFSSPSSNKAKVDTTFTVRFDNFRQMFQKHSRWEYEGEYRNVVTDRTRKGVSGCLKNVGEDAIEAIIFGHRIPQTSLKVLELICRDKGIGMYKALPNKSDYSVILEEHKY